MGLTLLTLFRCRHELLNDLGGGAWIERIKKGMEPHQVTVSARRSLEHHRDHSG